MEKYLKYLPVLTLFVGLVGTAYVTLDRQAAMANELEDQSESIDENEEAIEEIQRLLIQRQGEVEVRTQRIEIEQRQQGEDLDEVLFILQQLLQRSE